MEVGIAEGNLSSLSPLEIEGHIVVFTEADATVYLMPFL